MRKCKERERNQSNKLLKCIYVTMTAENQSTNLQQKTNSQNFRKLHVLRFSYSQVHLFWLMRKFQINNIFISFIYKKKHLWYRSMTWSITNCNCLFLIHRCFSHCFVHKIKFLATAIARFWLYCRNKNKIHRNSEQKESKSLWLKMLHEYSHAFHTMCISTFMQSNLLIKLFIESVSLTIKTQFHLISDVIVLKNSTHWVLHSVSMCMEERHNNEFS